MKRGSARNRTIDRWIGIPLVRASALLRSRHKVPANVRKIGVMTSTTLGDTLLASGAIQDIKAIWPAADLIFFAASQNRAAAELLPAVDRTVEFPLTRPFAAITALRREKLDILIDFSGWQRLSALLTARSGAPFTAGFRRAGQHRHFAYDFVTEHRGDRHETENFQAMVAGLREKTGEFHPLAVREDVWHSDLDSNWRDAVVFHCWATGTAHHLREWPENRWMELARRLHAQWPTAKFVLTGSPADLPRSEELATRLRAAEISAEVFSAPGLASVARLLRAARLVVSVNTGTMHLAAIVGAPVVSINGPNRHGRWGPIGTHAVSVESPGQGCGYLDLGWEWARDPSTNGVHSNCMERISVDAVMAGIQQALASQVHGTETHVGAH